MNRIVSSFSILTVMASMALAADTDWPGWHGPNRDGKSLDTGLLKEWPDDGPKLLWKVDGIGSGFSSVAIADGKVFTSGDRDGKMMLSAFDLEGKPLWDVPCDKNYSDGARSSPVVDSGNVYLLSGNGVLGCFDAASGKKKWSHEAKEFGGSHGQWGYAESVLIYKNMAIFKPGGKNCIVALDKATGETIWKSTGFEAGPEYGSSIAVTFEGQPMIVTGTREGIVGVDANNGKMLWSNHFSAGNTANCPTPSYADGYVFWANGYGRGAICLKLEKDGDKVMAEEAWKSRDMDCQHGSYVIDKGFVYGNGGGEWTCLDLKTGKKKWKERGAGVGSLCYADGMLYLFSDGGGQAALATCSPDGLQLKGKVKVKGDGPSWSHPAVAGGRLYLRYGKNLYCFDVKQAG